MFSLADVQLGLWVHVPLPCVCMCVCVRMRVCACVGMCVCASLEEGLRKGNEKYLYLNESSIIHFHWIQSYLQGGDKLLSRYTN